ncbi:MAG: trimethylamine methyltransferase family protein [Dehalococcoidia bacterium]
MDFKAPFYRPLQPEDAEQIDATSRRILAEVGLHVLAPDYFDRLEKAGARVDREGQRVYFEGSWLDDILSKAPDQFTLHSRDGHNDLHMGSGDSYFGNGGRVFRILDLGTGGYRYTLLRDVSNTATLVDHLPYLKFYIIACQAHNLEPESYHYNDFFWAFSHTTKHVMGGCDDLRGARQMWEVASLIAGGEDKLREKPFVSVITNVISPLTIDENALQILDFCTTRGIPVTCAPAPIAGATAPATLAGTLAQLHAEALAGVAITQVLSPGAKVLYGAVPTAMDLRTMEFTMGTAESSMMNAAAVQLAKIYKLPIYASAGLTEAKRPDIQAGFEKLFSTFTVGMTGADYIHLAAGMLDSGNSISYEQYVIDNEIIGMGHRIMAGINVNEGTLGFDTIKEVGPGGNFIAEEHTVNYMMEEFFYPTLSVRCNFDNWEEKGRPDMLSRAHEMVEEILEEGRHSRLDNRIIEQIKDTFPQIVRI